MTKTIKVRDALTELHDLLARRAEPAAALAAIDAKIARLNAQIGKVLDIPAPSAQGVRPAIDETQIPHARAIKMALVEGPRAAARVAMEIRQPEETTRRSLGLLREAGRVEHNGVTRGRASRWQLVGTVAQSGGTS